MVFDLKFQQIAHHALYLLNAWITKFNYLAAINTYNMVVLAVAV